MRKKFLKCSECDYELNPLFGCCYYVVDGEIICEDCFVDRVKSAVEENPARFAELLNVARVGVTN